MAVDRRGVGIEVAVGGVEVAAGEHMGGGEGGGGFAAREEEDAVVGCDKDYRG